MTVLPCADAASLELLPCFLSLGSWMAADCLHMQYWVGVHRIGKVKSCILGIDMIVPLEKHCQCLAPCADVQR